METPDVIKLTEVSKTFEVSDRSATSIRDTIFNLFSKSELHTIHAVQNLSLTIKKGEFIGLIGHNGCGKSTLMKLMLGAMRPDKGGKVWTQGRIILLSLGLGFDVNLTARENIYVNGSLLGLTFKRIGQKFDEIIEFAELQEFVDTKVKFYSRGMKTRLAFAVGIHAETDILMIDEFFGGVGDINFKKKSDAVFKDRLLAGKTIVYASHQMEVLKQYADWVLLLHEGKEVARGKAEEVLPIYEELMKERAAQRRKKNQT